MSSIPDVDALREEFRKKKEALAKKWEGSVDENGTFVAVFGDPAATPYATRVEVGFTEEDEVYVDLQPASEMEGGLEDSELMELESIAYTEAKFLDKDVPRFCCSIYDYLHGVSEHKSFDFTEYKALKVAEKNFKNADERRKAFNAEHSHERKAKDSYLQYYVKWEASFTTACRNNNKEKQAALLEKLKVWEGTGGLRRETKPTAEEVRIYGDLVSRIISMSSWAPIFTYTYKMLTEVPLIIRKLTKIEELNLSYNSIVVIPQEMTNFQYLRKLFVCGNKIKFLPPLSGLPNLEVLDAHSNEIIAFPSDIQHLKYLQTIDLERNQIGAVPAEISTLDRLSFLNLNRNNVKLIPPQLGYLSKLSYLKLAHNPIVNLPAHIYMKGTAASLSYLREYIPEAAHITESSLVSDISKCFDIELFSDVIFRSKEGRNFFAHRVVIDARCAYLYSKILDIEGGLKDVAEALSQSSISDKDASSSLQSAPISAASSHVSNVASLSGKRLYDAQNRLIVEVELSDQELEFLLKFIYGDVFEPQRPKLKETTSDMKPVEVEHIIALNNSLLADYYALCRRIGAVGEKFILPRFAQLAYQQASPSEKVPATTFFKDFEPFSLRPKHSDVSLLVDGRTFMTHKIILCARSEYFKSMLTSGLVESTLEVIPLVDVTYPVMRSILQFCYNDDVVCTSETVMDLLMTSRVYGLERLKGMVETIVGYSLDPSNAPGIYSIAELYAFKRLKKACKYFILSNWNHVTNTQDWLELPAELVDKLTLKAKNWNIVV